MRIPKHIGVIPDGNRRWADGNSMPKENGYRAGVDPGLQLFRQCKELGVKELTFYGFTTDNTKRPQKQRLAFTKACIDAVDVLTSEDAAILVVGNSNSNMFPEELSTYTTRRIFGSGAVKVNFLINYSWKWDIGRLGNNEQGFDVVSGIHSADVSRIDLIIRWGGRRRLSGFLPVQSVYSDFYVIDDYWPDFKPVHFDDAISWYQQQDITLGG